MEKPVQSNLAVVQLARIVNQLHRIVLAHPHNQDGPPSPISPSGMTISQASVMGYLLLQEERDVYQKDLERYFKLRRSTVSSMLNTLEKKGILQREPVSHDARLKKLVLTEQGRQISSLASQLFLQVNDFMIQGLTREELTTLAALLNKIETNLSSAEL